MSPRRSFSLGFHIHADRGVDGTHPHFNVFIGHNMVEVSRREISVAKDVDV